MHKVLFSSVARTATENSRPVASEGFKGGRFFLDITAASGTDETLDVKVQVQDEISGDWHDLTGAAFAQKTATGSAELTVFPGVAETANVSVSDILSSPFRVVGTIGGTDTPTFTYSVGVYLLD